MTIARDKGYRPGLRYGDYEVRHNVLADEDDRGSTIAWEVWNWRTETVESDWFTAQDACRAAIALDDQQAGG